MTRRQKRVTGISMIAALYLAVGIAGAIAIGPLNMLAIFGGVAVLMVWIYFGVRLATGGE